MEAHSSFGKPKMPEEIATEKNPKINEMIRHNITDHVPGREMLLRFI
jgi:hypothetical protein